MAALRALPEVSGAAQVGDLPLGRWRLPEQAFSKARKTPAVVWVLRGGAQVGAGLGLPITGRDLTEADLAEASSHPRALITWALARELFGALAGKKTAKQALYSAVERGNQMLRQFEKTAVH